MALQGLDFKAIKKAFEVSCVSATTDQVEEIVPIPVDFVHPLEVDPVTGFTDEYGPTRLPLLRHGLQLVGAVSLPSLGLLSITHPSTLDLRLQVLLQGKVAVLCLAGGQGTRLGSDAPKGMFDIGLPSHKSLFQIHCDRLWRIQAMAAFWCHGNRHDIRWFHCGHLSHSALHKVTALLMPFVVCRSPIQLVIMTSPATDQLTRQFFQQHNYFCLHHENVHFIVQVLQRCVLGAGSQRVCHFTFYIECRTCTLQDQLPCLTPDGKIIKATPSTLAMAPNGNGGMYTALVK